MTEIEDRLIATIRNLKQNRETIERTDLSLYDWITQTQELTINLAIHLEKIRGVLLELDWWDRRDNSL